MNLNYTLNVPTESLQVIYQRKDTVLLELAGLILQQTWMNRQSSATNKSAVMLCAKAAGAGA